MSLRQFVCSLLAVGVAVGLFFWLNPLLGTETTGWLCILGASPFAACGFFHYHGMTAEQFYNALQEEPVESVLNGTPLKNGELIEIDDGLASHFFYCYSQGTVLPAKVLGLKHEGGAHHA